MTKSFISEINSSVHYHSKVSYQIINSSASTKKYTHNTGCQYLFELCAKAIAGEDVRAMKPVLADLKTTNQPVPTDPGEDIVKEWVSVIPKKIALTGRQYSNLTEFGWSTVMTITIPWSAALALNITPDQTAYALCLYSQLNGLLAYFLIDKDTIDSFVQTGSGSSILVEWVMTVSNS